MDASDAGDPDDRRPLKRTRQACDPCRRKKSKCSGERPVCATCDRLRVKCSYTAQPFDGTDAGYGPNPTAASQTVSSLPATADSSGSAQQWQDRIESLESTLAEVLAGLRHRPDPDLRSSSFGYSPSRVTHGGRGSVRGDRPRSIRTAASSCENNSSFSADALFDDPGSLPWQLAGEMAEIYLKYCHSQPLPLFAPEDFVSTFANRDLSVICGVFALASRFACRSRSLPVVSPQDVESYADAARRRAMTEVISGRVELSTLQSLVLVALNNIHEGEMAQLRVHATLATGLARSARLDHSSSCDVGTRLAEERKRCYWSIVLLQRLTGDGSLAAQLTRSRLLPRIPASPVPPTITASDASVLPPRTPPLDEQNGILHVVIRLSEIWSQAQAYIQDRGSMERTVPPWSTDSAYSKALESVMQVDSQLAQVHRYRFMRFSSLEPRHLEEARNYWGPWLLSRLLYHTSICIFNHPILIMLQLQEWKNVPEVFLQQTTFQREHHVAWILHFIEFFEARQYYVSDPIFAYCASVLATIELHQSLGESSAHGSERQQQRRRNYERCLGFISDLSRTWPWLDFVTKRLERLREDLTAAYESNRTSSSNGNVRIDISSFLAILDISRVYSTEQQAGSDSSMFGRSLSLHSSPEPPRSADLQRLPGITEMDRSAETPPMHSNPGNADIPAVLSPDPYLYMDGSGQSMLFTIDQVFGSMFSPNLQAWDGMGLPAGGGGEAMYVNRPGVPGPQE